MCNSIKGLIWGEINSLYSSGIADYTSDLWNIIDFISNTFYVTWIGLRITSWYVVQVSEIFFPILVSKGVEKNDTIKIDRSIVGFFVGGFFFHLIQCREKCQLDRIHGIRVKNGIHMIRCCYQKVYLRPE